MARRRSPEMTMRDRRRASTAANDDAAGRGHRHFRRCLGSHRRNRRGRIPSPETTRAAERAAYDEIFGDAPPTRWILAGGAVLFPACRRTPVARLPPCRLRGAAPRRASSGFHPKRQTRLRATRRADPAARAGGGSRGLWAQLQALSYFHDVPTLPDGYSPFVTKMFKSCSVSV